MIVTAKKQKRAILIGLITRTQNEVQLTEYLDELAFLAETAGVITIKRFSQKLEKPDVRTFVGKGKLEEIKHFAEEKDIDLLIFDDELSPSQLRNIEKETQRKVLDRNNLILDIFASRAQTAHPKTQVYLAYYQYMLPRLTVLWTHLETQRGGTGTRGKSTVTHMIYEILKAAEKKVLLGGNVRGGANLELLNRVLLR